MAGYGSRFDEVDRQLENDAIQLGELKRNAERGIPYELPVQARPGQIPPETRSIFERVTGGLKQGAEEGLETTKRAFQSGKEMSSEALKEGLVDPDTGDLNIRSIGKLVLGIANIVGAAPSGMATTAAKTPLRVTESLGGTKFGSHPTAERLTDVGELTTGIALPVLPGAKLLNYIRRVPGTAGAATKITPKGPLALPGEIDRPLALPQGPTRIIEAPPGEGTATSRKIERRLRDEQAAATGEFDPEGPHARILTEPPARDPQGRVISGPKEKAPPPTGQGLVAPGSPKATWRETVGGEQPRPDYWREEVGTRGEDITTKPRDFKTGPSKSERVVVDETPPQRETRRTVADAPEATPSIRIAASAGDPLPNGDTGWLDTIKTNAQKTKAFLGINSMTEIARGDKAFEALVQKTKDASRSARALSDRWYDAMKTARGRLGANFEGVVEAIDKGKAVPQGIDPTDVKLVEDLLDDIGNTFGTTPGSPVIRSGNYTLGGILGDIRSAARGSVLGAYRTEVAPLMKEMKKRPKIISDVADAYYQWFTGFPGARGSAGAQAWADRLRSMQFVRTIGGNITSPLINATQQALTFAEVSPRAFFKAYSDLAKGRAAKMAGNKSEVEGLLERAGLSHELESAGMASDIDNIPRELLNKFDQGLAKLGDLTGWAFKGSEKFNRRHAFLAGYNDGIQRGMNESEAIDWGKKILDKTQFVGNEADLPPVYRSAMGSVVGQYKMFQTKYAEYLKNNFADIFKADATPEQRVEAAKKFAKFWGTQAAIGGTSGVPFVGEWLEDQIGQLPLDAQRGISGLLGASLANQVGSGVLPIASLRNFTFSLPGPTISMFQDAASVVSGKNMGEGFDFSRAGEDLTPDEMQRRTGRLLPAGTQINRIVNMFRLMETQGQAREATTGEEAWGLTPARGPLKRETISSPARAVLGLTGIEEERESRTRRRLMEHERIVGKAKSDAAEALARGDAAEPILREAEERLGLKPGSIKLSRQGAKEGRRRQETAPLQRAREEYRRRGEPFPVK